MIGGGFIKVVGYFYLVNVDFGCVGVCEFNDIIIGCVCVWDVCYKGRVVGDIEGCVIVQIEDLFHDGLLLLVRLFDLV